MSEAPENDAIDAADSQATDQADAQSGAPPGDAGGDPAPSFEDRALSMGWTPKGQFKGDPEKWVDAETFVKRGEEFLPFLRANNKRLEQALERANNKIEQMDKGLKSAIQQLSKADQRAYARAKAELEADLEQYATAGDAEGVKAVTKDLVELERETAGKASDDEPADAPEFAEFRADNAWYGRDKALSAAFDALCREVFEEGYTKPKAGLKEAFARLKEGFPEKFAKATNPNRAAPAAVEGVGAPHRTNGKTYADLPADAKQMCDELCRDMPKLMTREKFAKDYFALEAKK